VQPAAAAEEEEEEEEAEEAEEEAAAWVPGSVRAREGAEAAEAS
jgi:hypothetical protein